MSVKINVKVRQKARPFNRCKLMNLIFNFLEENLSHENSICEALGDLTVEILGKWPKLNFFSSLKTLDNYFEKNVFFANVTQRS
jgi:hypothetical protein